MFHLGTVVIILFSKEGKSPLVRLWWKLTMLSSSGGTLAEGSQVFVAPRGQYRDEPESNRKETTLFYATPLLSEHRHHRLTPVGCRWDRP